MNFHEITGVWTLEGMTPKAGTAAFMNAAVPAFGLLAHESLLSSFISKSSLLCPLV
jgi:hypothetical protein